MYSKFKLMFQPPVPQVSMYTRKGTLPCRRDSKSVTSMVWLHPTRSSQALALVSARLHSACHCDLMSPGDKSRGVGRLHRSISSHSALTFSAPARAFVRDVIASHNASSCSDATTTSKVIASPYVAVNCASNSSSVRVTVDTSS